jgi:murein DD-endopeptidase MepM/ murein hydrolase activator NlpD
MQEFDPRRPAFRLAPRLMMGVAGCCALALGWRLTGAEAHLPTQGMRIMDAAHIATLQNRAFAEATAQPGLAPAENVEVKILPGETFEAAVRRIGVGPDDARAAVRLLAGAFDVVNIRAGLAFQAAVAAPREERGPVRLVGLSMRTGPATAVTISRTFDGALHLRELAEEIHEETTVAQGSIEGSLYETAADQGSTSAITSQAAKLFSHKIDFSRDIHDGDTFKMVFTRKVTESGRTVEGGELLYAEVDADKGGSPIRFYRYQPKNGGEAQYFDENGKSIRGFLLQTPIAVVRITSGFGMRHHPVLGYNKVHQGIDFGGATGTPIYAAGDGVVEQAGRNGGYGNWVKLKHTGGWETGYAHMSRFAPGLHRGQTVKQGQLIGYVGATGRVTGPHLHYEVMKNGVKINPKGAKVPAGSVLAGAELAEFKRQKAVVDLALANADNAPVQTAAAEMRPAQVASR